MFVKPFPPSPHTPDHFSFENQMRYTCNGGRGGGEGVYPTTEFPDSCHGDKDSIVVNCEG